MILSVVLVYFLWGAWSGEGFVLQNRVGSKMKVSAVAT